MSSALGESPLWIAEVTSLFWVDIQERQLKRLDDGCPSVVATFEDPVTAIARAESGKLLLTLGHKVVKVDFSGNILEQVGILEGPSYPWRFNDGKVDPDGRFWVGLMSTDAEKGRGALYRMEKSGAFTKVLGDLTIPNGMAWDVAARNFFFIDSPEREVWKFRYDPVSGDLAERQTVIRVPPSMGIPDGMTLDKTGRLWIAHWGDGAVRCWDPENGRLVSEVGVEDRLSTSCCFGCNDLCTLFITTATGENSAGRLFQRAMTVGGSEGSAFLSKTKK